MRPLAGSLQHCDKSRRVEGYDAALASAIARVFGSSGVGSVSSAFPILSRAMVDPLRLDHPLVAIVGPTASGKSALAVRVGAALGGEIVNFDSVQVYRGCDVGSGKLPLAERQGVPHHLLDIAEPGSTFTAGDFRRAGQNVLAAV